MTQQTLSVYPVKTISIRVYTISDAQTTRCLKHALGIYYKTQRAALTTCVSTTQDVVALISTKLGLSVKRVPVLLKIPTVRWCVLQRPSVLTRQST